MEDYIDALHVHSDEVLTGTYWAKRPKTTDDKGEPFDYDMVEESDRAYSRLIEELQTDRTVCTIKTSEKINFKIKGYVATQDGMFWQISGFIKKLVSERNKQALRWFKETIDTEYVIRLIEVENPMELR